MNNFFKTILPILVLFAASCSKDDNNSNAAPMRDYATQYATDNANIQAFMKTHYMEVVDNPGATNDQDVTYHEIPEGGTQTSIWDDPRKMTHHVTQNNVDYTMYYIPFRDGSGATSKSPCNVDSVLTAYRGEYLYTDNETGKLISEQFEELKQPETYFDLTKVIRGWSEIFPKFKTGTYSGAKDGLYPPNSDGTISYYDFGAGVMFIPSGLAYYNQSKGVIKAYSPLIFSIKLYEVQRADNDGDGIPSFQEDLNGDGYMRILDKGVVNPDDTDGDGMPDFVDTDDDGDYYTTRSEITKPVNGKKGPSDYYPFDPIIIEDDLSTPNIDESLQSEPKGIPDINGDGTTPTRLRRHRDKTAKPPYTEY